MDLRSLTICDHAFASGLSIRSFPMSLGNTMIQPTRLMMSSRKHLCTVGSSIR